MNIQYYIKNSSSMKQNGNGPSNRGLDFDDIKQDNRSSYHSRHQSNAQLLKGGRSSQYQRAVVDPQDEQFFVSPSQVNVDISDVFSHCDAFEYEQQEENKKKAELKSKGSVFILKNEIDEQLDTQDGKEVPETEQEPKKGCIGKSVARVKAYKEKVDDLKSEFFTYEDGTLDAFDPDQDENKKVSFQTKFKAIMLKLLTYALILYIIYTYLETLGKEKSQFLKYISSLELIYNMTELPRLLPVHQFVFFNQTDIINRMDCTIHNNQEECLKIERRRCLSEGISSERYESCMIKLSKTIQQNGTEFCYNHYQDMTVWRDNYGPSKLGYWLRLHNCFDISGVPRARQYCLDYKDHEDSWGDDNLYNCYLKYHVEFSKEYCDKRFSGADQKYLLMQCYGVKGVQKGEEFCTSNFDSSTELPQLLECYETIPLYTQNYCKLKNPIVGDDFTALRTCYTDLAKLVLNQAFCDDQFPLGTDVKTVLDNRYQCYKEIGFKDEKDREYCELVNINDMQAKYDCIDTIIQPKLKKINDDCVSQNAPNNKCPETIRQRCVYLLTDPTLVFRCIETKIAECTTSLTSDNTNSCISQFRSSCEKSTPDNVEQCLTDLNKDCTAYIPKYAEIEKCKLDKKLEILASGKLIIRGADYCYFKFPYQNEYDERYSCLREQAIDNKYLSSYCEMKYHYLKTIGNNKYSDQSFFECLNNKDYNINFDVSNQCSKYLLAPDNQDYIIETLTSDKIKNYEMSLDMQTGNKNFIYTKNDLNLMTSDQVIFLGSHSSFKQEDKSFHIWILEHFFTDFVNYKEKKELKQSFGNFLIRKQKFETWQELVEDAEMMVKEKAKYENPMLEENEITIQVYDNKVEEKVDAEAVKSSEQMTAAFGMLQRSENVGKLLDDLDSFMADKQMPTDDSLSMKVYKELTSQQGASDLTPPQLLEQGLAKKLPLITAIDTEYKALMEDPFFKSLETKELNVAVAKQLLVDLSMASPAIDSIVKSYKGPEEQPFVGQIVNEVYQQLDTGKETMRRLLQEGPVIKAPNFSELSNSLLKMPVFSQLAGDFNSLMAVTSGNIQSGNIPELSSANAMVSELAIDSIAESAVQNKNEALAEQEKQKQEARDAQKNAIFFDVSAVSFLTDELKLYQPQLVEEFYTLRSVYQEGSLVNSLINELNQAVVDTDILGQSDDALWDQIIKKWILKEKTAIIINDLKQILEDSRELNFPDKILSEDELDKIIEDLDSRYRSSVMLEAIYSFDDLGEIVNKTEEQFQSQQKVTLGDVFGNQVFQQQTVSRFKDQVFDLLDLGLNITHVDEIVEMIQGTQYAGELAQAYFATNKSKETKTKIVEEGWWGDWLDFVYGPKDSYACGAQIQFLESQGTGDDYGMTGVRIKFCNKDNWHVQETKTIYESQIGTWRENATCSSWSYIVSMSLQMEPQETNPVGDDTAADGMKIICASRYNFEIWEEIPVFIEPNNWGEFGNFTTVEQYFFVNGIRLRNENELICSDCTGVNGVELAFIKGDQETKVDDLVGELFQTIEEFDPCDDYDNKMVIFDQWIRQNNTYQVIQDIKNVLAYHQDAYDENLGLKFITKDILTELQWYIESDAQYLEVFTQLLDSEILKAPLSDIANLISQNQALELHDIIVYLQDNNFAIIDDLLKEAQVYFYNDEELFIDPQALADQLLNKTQFAGDFYNITQRQFDNWNYTEPERQPCYSWNQKEWIGVAPESPAFTECGLEECILCSTQNSTNQTNQLDSVRLMKDLIDSMGMIQNETGIQFLNSTGFFNISGLNETTVPLVIDKWIYSPSVQQAIKDVQYAINTYIRNNDTGINKEIIESVLNTDSQFIEMLRQVIEQPKTFEILKGKQDELCDDFIFWAEDYIDKNITKNDTVSVMTETMIDIIDYHRISKWRHSQTLNYFQIQYLIQKLDKTVYAGEFAWESYTLTASDLASDDVPEGKQIIDNVMGELDQAMNGKDLLNLKSGEVIDLITEWASLNTTYQIISDVKKVLQSNIQSNGTIGDKKFSYYSLIDTFRDLENNDASIGASIRGLVKELPQSYEIYKGFFRYYGRDFYSLANLTRTNETIIATWFLETAISLMEIEGGFNITTPEKPYDSLEDPYLNLDQIEYILDDLQETEFAGKLVPELFTLTQNDTEYDDVSNKFIIDDIFNELAQAAEENIMRFEKLGEEEIKEVINKWIQMNQTYQIIKDVKSAVYSDINIGGKILEVDTFEKILDGITNQTLLESLNDLLSLQEAAALVNDWDQYDPKDMELTIGQVANILAVNQTFTANLFQQCAIQIFNVDQGLADFYYDPYVSTELIEFLVDSLQMQSYAGNFSREFYTFNPNEFESTVVMGMTSDLAIAIGEDYIEKGSASIPDDAFGVILDKWIQQNTTYQTIQQVKEVLKSSVSENGTSLYNKFVSQDKIMQIYYDFLKAGNESATMLKAMENLKSVNSFLDLLYDTMDLIEKPPDQQVGFILENTLNISRTQQLFKDFLIDFIGDQSQISDDPFLNFDSVTSLLELFKQKEITGFLAEDFFKFPDEPSDSILSIMGELEESFIANEVDEIIFFAYDEGMQRQILDRWIQSNYTYQYIQQTKQVFTSQQGFDVGQKLVNVTTISSLFSQSEPIYQDSLINLTTMPYTQKIYKDLEGYLQNNTRSGLITDYLFQNQTIVMNLFQEYIFSVLDVELPEKVTGFIQTRHIEYLLRVLKDYTYYGYNLALEYYTINELNFEYESNIKTIKLLRDLSRAIDPDLDPTNINSTQTLEIMNKWIQHQQVYDTIKEIKLVLSSLPGLYDANVTRQNVTSILNQFNSTHPEFVTPLLNLSIADRLLSYNGTYTAGALVDKLLKNDVQMVFKETLLDIIDAKDSPDGEYSPYLQSDDVVNFVDSLEGNARVLADQFYTITPEQFFGGENIGDNDPAFTMVNEFTSTLLQSEEDFMETLGALFLPNKTDEILAKMNKWIQNPMTYGIIQEIKRKLYDRDLGDKILNIDDLFEDLSRRFENSPIMVSFFNLTTVPYANELAGELEQWLLKENLTLNSLAEEIKQNQTMMTKLFADSTIYTFDIQLYGEYFDVENLNIDDIENLVDRIQNTSLAGGFIEDFYSITLETATNDTISKQLFVAYNVSEVLQDLVSDKNLFEFTDQNFQDTLDLWISNQTVKSVIDEIKASINETNLLEKKVSEQMNMFNIGLFQMSDQRSEKMAMAVYAMIGSMNSTLKIFQNVNETLDQEGKITVGQILDEHIKPFYLEVFKDYLIDYSDQQKEGARRRLQTFSDSYTLGTWHFETINQIVAEFPSSDEVFRFNILSGSKLRIRKEKKDGSSSTSYDFQLGSPGDSNLMLNTYNVRNVTVKSAIQEMIGDRMSIKPKLDCHIVTNLQGMTLWKMHLEKEYCVTSVKIFVMKNGAKTSGLELGAIYMDNAKCANIGKQLPENDYVEFICQKPDAPPKNVFNTDQNQDEFKGTCGSVLTIASNEPTLTVCDIEVKIKIPDENSAKAIQQKKDQCSTWQNQCRANHDLSADSMQGENKFNCLERYGVNKTSQFCIESLNANKKLLQFSYPLKNKYECLTNPTNEFPQTIVNDDIGNCLNLYYDYQIEKCLEKYEAKYDNQVGFNGKEAGQTKAVKPAVDDPFSIQKRYWNVYTNLTLAKAELLKLQEFEAIQKAVNNTSAKSQTAIQLVFVDKKEPYAPTFAEIKDYLCGNVFMQFYTDPYKDQTSENFMLIDMNCRVFEAENNQLGMHFYFDKFETLHFNKSAGNDTVFWVNRTDYNEQFFKLTFTDKLEFIKAGPNEMYFNEQDPQLGYLQIPQIGSKKEFEEFRSQPNVVMLYESENITIAEQYMQETSLISVPRRNESITVQDTTMPKLWKYPVFWTNTDDNKILISPENNKRFAMRLPEELRHQKEYSNIVNLKFDFFKMEFTYTFTNIKNFFSELGGVGKLAEETLGGLASVLLILFFLDLVNVVRKKHQHDHREYTLQRLSKMLPMYYEVAQAYKETQEVEDIKEMMETLDELKKAQGGFEKLAIQKEDKFSHQLSEQDANTYVEKLTAWEKKYHKDAKKQIRKLLKEQNELSKNGQQVKLLPNGFKYEILDDTPVVKDHYERASKMSIFDIAVELKKRVSFLGIYFSYDGCNFADWNYQGVRAAMNKVTNVLLDQQNKLNKIIKKEKIINDQVIEGAVNNLCKIKEEKLMEVQTLKNSDFENQFSNFKKELHQLRQTVVEKQEEIKSEQEASVSEVEPNNDQVFEQQMKQYKKRTATLTPKNFKDFASFKGEIGNLRKTIVNLPAQQIQEEIKELQYNKDLLEELDVAEDKTKIIEQLMKIINRTIRKSNRTCKDAQKAIQEVDRCISAKDHPMKREVLKRLEESSMDIFFDRVTQICKKLSKLPASHFANHDLEDILSSLKDLDSSWTNVNADLQNMMEIDQQRLWDTNTPGQEETLDLVQEQQSWNNIKKVGKYINDTMQEMLLHLEKIQ